VAVNLLSQVIDQLYHMMLYRVKMRMPEFLKFVRPIRPRGQKIMRSANKVGNAGPHVRQTFLNDVLTLLTEVGNAGRIVNTGTSSVNSE
jgi:hypothetical protein